ncbi:hypothetical protein SAMN05414139_08829 [Burkholderia sp. D7]|nr:hypothetical protein SAMN05414139_08829 [Burkholderia sp. D7]
MTDTTPERVAYTINRFCSLYHIGRTNYYVLQKTGEGPVELRAGPRKVLITRRSAEEWERRCEKRAANDANASDAA